MVLVLNVDKLFKMVKVHKKDCWYVLNRKGKRAIAGYWKDVTSREKAQELARKEGENFDFSECKWCKPFSKE